MPRVLRRLTSQDDLFLILSLASGLVLAGIGSEIAGIPLALAAFIAGLAIRESEQAAEARRRLLPFREVFAVLFFVLIGALIDPSQLPSAPWIAFFVGLIIASKVVMVAALARNAPPACPLLAAGSGPRPDWGIQLRAVVAGKRCRAHLAATARCSLGLCRVHHRSVSGTGPPGVPPAGCGSAGGVKHCALSRL